MRRFTGILALLLAAILMSVACGGSGQGGGGQSNPPETTENASSPKTLPEVGPLAAGRYRSEEFEPAFALELGEGWDSGAPELEESIFLVRGEDGFDGFLGFDNPQKVFDPKKLAEEQEIPAPDTVDGWVAWHQRNPYFDISNLEPTTVGGASGVRFDLEVTSAPKKFTKTCGVPCVPLYRVGSSDLDIVFSALEEDERKYILEVGDEIVIVSVSATEGEVDEFLSEAQKVLDTVEWKAEP